MSPEFTSLTFVEPPSHILTDPANLTDPLPEDPLSGYIFMIVDTPSDEEEGYFVCACLAHTGMSYIGRTGGMES